VIRRPLWLATGVVVGVGGTLWTQQRVRKVIDQAQARLSPEHMVRGAARSAQGIPARVRAANAAAAEERRRRERELRERFAHPRGEAAAPDLAVIGRPRTAAGRRR
jgi:hypothetical protein